MPVLLEGQSVRFTRSVPRLGKQRQLHSQAVFSSDQLLCLVITLERAHWYEAAIESSTPDLLSDPNKVTGFLNHTWVGSFFALFSVPHLGWRDAFLCLPKKSQTLKQTTTNIRKSGAKPNLVVCPHDPSTGVGERWRQEEQELGVVGS